MSKSLSLDHLTVGVCYYPEHWDKSLWRDDLKKMKEYGIEVIRIAEFAWNYFEPHEGEFTYEFFDEFMDLTAEEGMKVIFCTPTATPPAWMSHKYPEILNADIDGNLIQHGLRRHCNLNSEKYRYFSSRITGQLASHYGKYDNIIMWQLDNEINCECDVYYSESDHKAFRKYLKERFGDLDTLNKEIGAAFWNQTYTDWEEVCLPRKTIYGKYGNPHMDLLQKRFISDTVISYFKLQADIIRKYSKAYVTTNGIFPHLDYHKLVGEVLDFITFDSYPNFAYERHQDVHAQNGLKDRNSSKSLSMVRSISPVFGIMEQQSGPGGWTFRMEQSAPKPGQLRLWAMQSVAHGADYVSFFRWRTATFGTEIYWHGLFDYCNQPNRRTEELQKFTADLKKLNPLCGKEYVAEVAILRDYDNIWDAEEDHWHSEVDQISQDGWFKALQKKHIPFDYVDLNDDTKAKDLFKYKLLVYPHPTIFNRIRTDILEKYIKHGGTVIFGCRSGYKRENGSCYMMPMPGYVADLVGAEVEDFTFLNPYDEDPWVNIGTMTVSAPCFADVLRITDGKEIGVFATNYYAGKTAVSVKKTGKGKAYYFGAAFAEDTASLFLEMERITPPMEIGALIDLPEGVELAIRGEYVILLNYQPKALSFKCRAAFKDLLTGKKFQRSITMEAYGVVVLERVTLKVMI